MPRKKNPVLPESAPEEPTEELLEEVEDAEDGEIIQLDAKTRVRRTDDRNLILESLETKTRRGSEEKYEAWVIRGYHTYWRFIYKSWIAYRTRKDPSGTVKQLEATVNKIDDMFTRAERLGEITDALTRNPTSKYAGLSDADAINACLQLLGINPVPPKRTRKARP